jgi:DNA polymerase III delta prime subunit
MSQPIIHDQTRVMIDNLLGDLPQALMITGPAGVGLATISELIAHKLDIFPVVVLPEKDEKVDLEKGTITVTLIRRLYEQTRTIETGHRIIIINDIDRAGVPAQNAFLKLLEEPSVNTHFIVTTHSPSLLLSTIRSRVQELRLQSITPGQSDALLDALNVKNATTRTQLLFMAEGLPAELTRLATNTDYFAERSQIIRDARELLQASTYQKLLVTSKYKDSRPNSLILLQYAITIVRRTMSAKPTAELVNQLNRLLTTYDQIGANANIRLQLARLVVY